MCMIFSSFDASVKILKRENTCYIYYKISSFDVSASLLDECFLTVRPSFDELLLCGSSECVVEPTVSAVMLEMRRARYWKYVSVLVCN